MIRRLVACVAAVASIAAVGSAPAMTMQASGFDSTTLERIDRAVSGAFIANDSPGYAVGVWAPGRGEYLRAYGVANRRTGAPLQVEDHFRIGSVTKTLTAVTVLRLVEQGKLSLGDHLERFVPGIAYGRRITIRQLLAMQAGVFDFTSGSWFMKPYENLTMPWTPSQTIELIRRGEPQYPPGASARYDNSNYVLLGRVIERVTGRSALDVIREEVIEPAGLADTTLATRTGLPGPFRRGYEIAINGNLRDTTIINPSIPWTAGNAISTLRDMGTWGRVLATGALLSPRMRALQAQGTHLVGGDPGTRYGLGMGILPGDWRGHSGYVYGYNTAVYHQPSSGVTIVTTGTFGADDALAGIIDVLEP